MLNKLEKLGWTCITQTPTLENYIHEDGSELLIMYHSNDLMLLVDIDSDNEHLPTKKLLQDWYTERNQEENDYDI